MNSKTTLFVLIGVLSANLTNALPLVTITPQDSPLVTIFDEDPVSVTYIVTNNAPSTHTFVWVPYSITSGGSATEITGLCQEIFDDEELLSRKLNQLPDCGVNTVTFKAINKSIKTVTSKKTYFTSTLPNKLTDISDCVSFTASSKRSSFGANITQYPFSLDAYQSCLLNLTIYPNSIAPTGLLSAPVVCRTKAQNCIPGGQNVVPNINDDCSIASDDLSMCAIPSPSDRLNITFAN